MNLIELIMTVCSLAHPDVCEDKHIQFVDQGSLRQCMFDAEPVMAQWVGQHPNEQIVKWRCTYPDMEGNPI